MSATPLLGIDVSRVHTEAKFPLGMRAVDPADPRNEYVYVQTASDIAGTDALPIAVKVADNFLVSAATGTDRIFGALRCDTEDANAKYCWCQIKGIFPVGVMAIDSGSYSAGAAIDRVLATNVTQTVVATTSDVWGHVCLDTAGAEEVFVA